MAIQGVGNSQNYFAPDDSPSLRRHSNLTDSPTNRPQVAEPEKQIVTMSTDKVDNEIETLKSKGLALAKSINGYDDEETRLHLEEELKQIQNELRQKDNDIYRRQNAQISLSVDISA